MVSWNLSSLESIVKAHSRLSRKYVVSAAAAGMMLFSYMQSYLPANAMNNPIKGDSSNSASISAPLITSINGKQLVSGMVIDDLGAKIAWKNPSGATQYQIKLTPYNNDGPGINLIRNIESEFTINSPSTSENRDYVMLPGMSYTLGVRVSNSTLALSEDTSEWSNWNTVKFKTPVPDYKMSIVSPDDESKADSINSVKWSSSSNKLFYYEIQVSPDSEFKGSWVWHNIVHGGITGNSWAFPEQIPSGKYFWRVRPRVQGDGRETAWSKAWSFSSGTVQSLQNSEPTISGIVFNDYNGNGIMNPGEPVIPQARIIFRNTENNEEAIATSNASGRYTVSASKGITSVSIEAVLDGQRMNYFFPSSSNLYKLDDNNRKFGVKVENSMQYNLGLGQGRNTLPFASNIRARTTQPFNSTHNGIDYAFYDNQNKVISNVEVLATAPGEVVFAQHLACPGETVPQLQVMIEHPDGGSTLYGHLGSIVVEKGQKVARGEVLGLHGNGGAPACSRGPHLHLSDGEKVGFKGGKYFNPEANWTAGVGKYSR